MRTQKIILISVLLLTPFAWSSIQNEEAGQDFNNYIKMASNDKLNMNSRWTSLIQSANFAEVDQISEIKKFTTHKEWYMRNASLVALQKADPNEAEVQARKLIKDKALVVRSAAVEILGKNLTTENKNVLQEEIHQSYNFNKKSSLWIRKQILDKLAKVATKQDQNIFVKTLFDNDKKISELSAKTLEKITGEKLARKKFVENWRQLAKQRKWM